MNLKRKKMSHRVLILILLLSGSLLVNCLSLMPCSNNDGQDYILNTNTGPLIGSCEFVEINEPSQTTLRNANVYSWLSVPYAEAPIGKNRFMKTVEKQLWTKPLDATKRPNVCIQDSDLYSQSNFKGINMWKPTGPFSEDCLYLNIWAPAEAYHKHDRLPILVFFHGGGTNQGSASDIDLYDPATFVAVTNVIVITVNYRLGAFGFFKLGTIFPGNQALYDQTEALKWINSNANNIGGDPERITVSGHGSGATLAGYHLFIKQSHDLFRNIILQSGTPLSASLTPIATDLAETRARQLLVKLDCNPEHDYVNCLQTTSKDITVASQELLNEFTNDDFVSKIYFKTFFPPCIDNILILKSPEDSLVSGHFKQCSILTGYVAHEASFEIGLVLSQKYKQLDTTKIDQNAFSDFLHSYYRYSPGTQSTNNQLFFDSIIHEYTKQTKGTEELNIPTDLVTKIQYFRQLVRVLSDQEYVCPTYRLSDFFAELNNNVYMYLYSHRVSSTPWPKQYGAVHGDDLAFTFAFPLQTKNATSNVWSMPHGEYFKNEKLLANEIVNYWSNFVKYDTPNNPEKEVEWPEYKLIKRTEDEFSRNQDLSAKYMVFKSTGNRVSRGYSLEACIFWNSYLPRVLKNHEILVEERINNLPPCPTPAPTVPVTCPTTPIITETETSTKPLLTKITTLTAAIKNQKANKPTVNQSTNNCEKFINNNLYIVLVLFSNVFFLSMF